METQESVQRWVEERCKVPVTLDDLSKDIAPMTTEKPTTYAILLSNINYWPIPNSVLKKLETACLDGVHETNIICSISMSFFHTLSKRFYGSTFVGHEHPISIKQSNTSLRVPMDNLNELVYFHSRLNDPNCYVVIELVLALLSPLDGSVAKRYSCGWSLITPFLAISKKEQEDEMPDMTGHTSLYDGSPRDLLELNGNGSSILKQLDAKNQAGKASSLLSYTIWRPHGLGAVLASCVKENEIVGAHTQIAGLRSTTIHCFDNRGSVGANCVGARTRGNVLDWTLLPIKMIPSTDMIARPSSLNLQNALVNIPNRLEYERQLTSWVAHALPKGSRHLLNKMSSLFGWHKYAKGDEKGRSENTIIHRRLKVGVHNGHTILNDRWHELELHSCDNGDDPDKLQAADMTVSNYIEHPSSVILCVVEYTVETLQVASLQTPKKTTSPNALSTVLGMAVCCPFDRVDSERSVVSLNLLRDERCQALFADPLFLPGDSAEPSLSFELCACDTESTETPQQNDKTRNAKVQTGDDSISLDKSAKSRHIAFKDSCSEAKEDCSSCYSSRVHEEISSFPDTSTLTFDNSAREEAKTNVTPVRESSVNPVSAVHDNNNSKSSYSVSFEEGGESDKKKDGVVAQCLQSKCQEVKSVAEEIRSHHSGMSSTEAGQTSFGASVRQQQLQAVEDYRLQRLKDGDTLPAEALCSFFQDVTDQQGGQYEVDYQVLNAVQWAREGKKKQIIAKHVANNLQ